MSSAIFCDRIKSAKGNVIMANLKCHECGKEFIKTALVCPACGVKTKRPSTAFEKFILVGACLVFIVPLVAFVVIGMEQDAQKKAQAEAAATEEAPPAPTQDAAE
jgi:hypothetical protein